jgi:ABC-type glycerol-3-phosphate transport system substrate-binding protein
MKNKMLAVVLAGMLALGAVACGGDGADDTDTGTASEATS